MELIGLVALVPTMLFVLAVAKIVKDGWYSLFEFGKLNTQRREGVKSYGSLNVALFSFLWMVGIIVFRGLGFSWFMNTYLCFCLLFACYGISELYARIIWFRQLVGAYSFMSVAKGAIYPVFFVVNHAPLYFFLSKFSLHERVFDLFLILQLFHLVLYMIHGYKARIVQKRDKVIKSYYYVGRLIAVTSYIILLVGFII